RRERPMRLRDVASNSFVLVRADASAGEARASLEGTTATRVIVKGSGGGAWSLVPSEAAKRALSAAAATATVALALGLDRHPATKALRGDPPISEPHGDVIRG